MIGQYNNNNSLPQQHPNPFITAGSLVNGADMNTGKFFTNSGSVHSSPISPASSEEPVGGHFQALSASSIYNSPEQHLMPIASSVVQPQHHLFYGQNAPQMFPSTSSFSGRETYSIPLTQTDASIITHQNHLNNNTIQHQMVKSLFY